MAVYINLYYTTYINGQMIYMYIGL